MKYNKKAVIFDLDGVICFTDKFHYEAWKRLAYLEADIQQHKENKQRDYSQMKEYYDKAVGLYQKQEHSDGEMQQLEAMMKELQDGKWFQ